MTISSDMSADPSVLTASPQATQTRKSSASNVVAIVLGNGLEMYDFTVYSFFAAIIGKLYFPVSSSLGALLLSLATFGVGFFMRPLGAVLIGNYADKRGRKAALTLTILLMTIGTALIAFTPTYHQIGIAATLLLVMGRLLQGLSAGGEIGASSAMLMESGLAHRRCFLVSWQTASQGAAALCGALIGVGLSTAFTPAELESGWWRLPFILGLLIAPVGMYIRRQLDETHVVTAEHEHKVSLRDVLRQHYRTLLLGILLMVASTSSMYLEVFYMPTYLIRNLHFPSSTAFAVASLAGAILFLVPPFVGKYCDTLKSRKTLPVCAMVLSLLVTYPAFLLLQQSTELLQAMLIIGGLILIMTAVASTIFVLMMEAFEPFSRATGISIMYAFGVTIFGGFAPFFVTALMAWTGSALVPAWYLMAATFISLIAMLLFPERRLP
ncbi:MFS transporter [Pokkaliibacter sp. MBI-7]|uniref:MFS transporter n=1 Tax=Pokkaliibacter sp. MBI-7 TaxID=3040600 RepID=UPI002449B35E|nr:MFS transporter [Pokkaliibacter sp. MBI-7]MDH2431511.1 MFS transporter [Pokkaliibacter sp. MBI-7]